MSRSPEDLTYEQLARDLVKVGLEEEEIHASQVTGPIVVGYVVDATPEPQKNGKTINWCHVDVGEEYNEVDENGNKVPPRHRVRRPEHEGRGEGRRHVAGCRAAR